MSTYERAVRGYRNLNGPLLERLADLAGDLTPLQAKVIDAAIERIEVMGHEAAYMESSRDIWRQECEPA